MANKSKRRNQRYLAVHKFMYPSLDNFEAPSCSLLASSMTIYMHGCLEAWKETYKIPVPELLKLRFSIIFFRAVIFTCFYLSDGKL